jgi:hypothetical protein
MRFGSYRVFTFPAGANNPTILAASRQQGVGVSEFSVDFQTMGRCKSNFSTVQNPRTNSRTLSYGILQLT